MTDLERVAAAFSHMDARRQQPWFAWSGLRRPTRHVFDRICILCRPCYERMLVVESDELQDLVQQRRH